MHEPLIVRIAPRDRYRKAASNAAVPPPMDLVPLRRTARTGTNKAYSHFHPPATVVPEEEPQHHEVEYLSDQDDIPRSDDEGRRARRCQKSRQKDNHTISPNNESSTQTDIPVDTSTIFTTNVRVTEMETSTEALACINTYSSGQTMQQDRQPTAIEALQEPASNEHPFGLPSDLSGGLATDQDEDWSNLLAYLPSADQSNDLVLDNGDSILQLSGIPATSFNPTPLSIATSFSNSTSKNQIPNYQPKI